MLSRHNIVQRSLVKHLLLLATLLGSLGLGNSLSKADSQDHLHVNLYLIQSDSNLKRYGKGLLTRLLRRSRPDLG